MIETETLIVGGGLAGLSLADQLMARGRPFALLEARDRLGGRILTTHHAGAPLDMGPAWFWHGQPRLARLLKRFGLTAFDQYTAGDTLFESGHGAVIQQRGHGSMIGSFRIEGGMGALTARLASTLDANRVHLGLQVLHLQNAESGVAVETAEGALFRATRVVLALPPRLAAGMRFTPNPAPAAHQAMARIATWMADQAKAVAIYDAPFWREAGLSGDAISRLGPLVEIHDASAPSGGPFALFGFIGVPPRGRTNEDTLRQLVIAQLARLFGPRAAKPLAVEIKDWALDRFTATANDLQPVHAHPRYGMPEAIADLWAGRLIFASTEVAPHSGGFLEGALEAAENALATLERVHA